MRETLNNTESMTGDTNIEGEQKLMSTLCKTVYIYTHTHTPVCACFLSLLPFQTCWSGCVLSLCGPSDMRVCVCLTVMLFQSVGCHAERVSICLEILRSTCC